MSTGLSGLNSKVCAAVALVVTALAPAAWADPRLFAAAPSASSSPTVQRLAQAAAGPSTGGGDSPYISSKPDAGGKPVPAPPSPPEHVPDQAAVTAPASSRAAPSAAPTPAPVTPTATPAIIQPAAPNPPAATIASPGVKPVPQAPAAGETPLPTPAKSAPEAPSPAAPSPPESAAESAGAHTSPETVKPTPIAPQIQPVTPKTPSPAIQAATPPVAARTTVASTPQVGQLKPKPHPHVARRDGPHVIHRDEDTVVSNDPIPPWTIGRHHPDVQTDADGRRYVVVRTYRYDCEPQWSVGIWFMHRDLHCD